MSLHKIIYLWSREVIIFYTLTQKRFVTNAFHLKCCTNCYGGGVYRDIGLCTYPGGSFFMSLWIHLRFPLEYISRVKGRPESLPANRPFKKAVDTKLPYSLNHWVLTASFAKQLTLSANEEKVMLTLGKGKLCTTSP